MELRHLRSFATLAQTLHFGRAADLLHISQPPLSEQIQRLEREVGMALFERNRRGVTLTAAGEQLLPWVHEVLAASDQLLVVADQLRRAERGVLHIGHIGSAMLANFPDIIREFSAAHPKAELSLRQMETDAQIQALRTRHIDVAVCRSPGRHEDLASLLITEEPILAAVNASSPLADSQVPVSLSIFKGLKFVGPPVSSESMFWGLVRELCAPHGYVPEVDYRSDNLFNIVGFVEANLGVALVPQCATSIAFKDVRYLAVDDPNAKLPLHMLWRRQRGFPILDEFLTIARAVTGSTPHPIDLGSTSRRLPDTY
ncbi:LysR substrate-binding domain-containing protein [Rhodococcus opacus]|nr:LysR substrate-binding domain-containing protein [Rhodococcus opacus]